jgi:hypothetical protein
MSVSPARLAFIPLFIATLTTGAAPPTPNEVDASIKKAVAWLYSKQDQKGHWEEKEAPEGDLKGKDRNTPTGGQWGGYTAIATYALLDAGEPWKDPRIKKAAEWLHRAQITGVYALSLRANIWHYLPQSTNVKKAADRDSYMLLGGMKSKGDADGFWGYSVNDGATGYYDHSTSQFALLGIWACQQAGREVPRRFWEESERAWGNHQYADGSWGYTFKKDAPEARLSMTLAGVATLFLAQDYTHITDGLDCKGNIFDPRLVKGTRYIRDNFEQAMTLGNQQGRKYYTLYGVERVAMASGFKYFGDIDWYKRGAETIVKSQSADGSWGSVPDTAFALIFLSRGRAPVIVNKFEYELDPSAASASAKPAVRQAPAPPKPPPAASGQRPGIRIGGAEARPTTPAPSAAEPDASATTANWHQRPRDVAVFTRWLSNTTERKLNWQIVSNRASVDDLHDAPILYISGNQKLTLPDATVARLKQYIEEGGLVFANPDCTHKDFISSFQELGKKMFPAYEFRELPAEHPIYTLQPFRRKDWKQPPSVLGLSNGTRELMIISPNLDFARYWQNGNYSGRPEAYQLMSCITLYAVDRQNLKYKGGTHIVRADANAAAGRKIKLARVEYGGNWNPEPAGWARLANILKNQKQAELAIEPLKLGESKLDESFQIAHLTGTTSFSISKEQLSELRRFIIKGGTILADAAGGNTEFAEAAIKELEPLVGGAKFELIPAHDPILAAIKDPGAPAISESMVAPPPVPADPNAELPLGGKMPAATTQVAVTTAPTTAPASSQPTQVLLDGNFPVEYRQFAKSRIGSTQSLRLKGLKLRGRWAVIISAEDFSTGLVGQQVDGIHGYTPACATEVTRRILLNITTK